MAQRSHYSLKISMGTTRTRFFVFILLSAGGLSSTKSSEVTTPCEESLSIEIPNAVAYDNGSLWDPDGMVMYPSGTHWSTPTGTNSTGKSAKLACPCKLHGRPCLRKCCPIGNTVKDGNCFPIAKNAFTLNVTEEGEDFDEVDAENHFYLLFGNICAGRRFLLEPDIYTSDEFWINKSTGRLVMPNQNMTDHGPMDFCMDYIPDKFAYLPLICLHAEINISDSDSNKIVYIIYPIFMIISILFLILTFLVYALTPELRNLHGKCLMSHIGSLVVTYICLAIVQLGGNTISDHVCISTAYTIQYAFLATFFWLNAMCFDICITFSGMRPMTGSAKERERKKFILYSLYSWICPLIVLIIALVMDFAPGIPEHHAKPRFGLSRCWFHGEGDAFAYFYGPVAVLITSNVIMFIITAVKIVKLSRQADVLKKKGSGSSDDKENRKRFILYLKLLIVMGVNWAMEVVSWAVGGPDYLWYLTDIGNTLQGFFIFLIFVWKGKIRRMVLQKLCPKYATRREKSTTSSRIWRGNRGSSPNKFSSSGCTGKSTAFTSQSSEGIKLKSIKPNNSSISNIEKEDFEF